MLLLGSAGGQVAAQELCRIAEDDKHDEECCKVKACVSDATHLATRALPPSARRTVRQHFVEVRTTERDVANLIRLRELLAAKIPKFHGLFSLFEIVREFC